jgi:diguanylate cyclase (GGDEF)-like protein/PAS domain S-box-containing protein
VHPEDRKRILDQVRRQDSGELKYNEFEYRERHRNGHWVWILSRGKPVEWKPDGSVARILGTDTDISGLKEVESRLAAEKELVAVTLESIADGVISTDPSHHIVLINPVAQELTGWTHEEACGKPLRLIFQVEEEDTGSSTIGPVLASLGGLAQRLLRDGTLLVAASGETRVIRECASVVRKSDGSVVGGVLVFQDVTESHAIRRNLSYAATHDALTELANRTAFEQALVEAIADARGNRRQHALCFMDLDRFKQVNDSAGHAAGDALLKMVATAVRQSCRSQDLSSRIGGDEFALILRDCSLAAARNIAEEIVRAIEDLTLGWRGRAYRIGASIGVVPIDANSSSPEAILEQADAACYAEKRSRRG